MFDKGQFDVTMKITCIHNYKHMCICGCKITHERNCIFTRIFLWSKDAVGGHRYEMNTALLERLLCLQEEESCVICCSVRYSSCPQCVSF